MEVRKLAKFRATVQFRSIALIKPAQNGANYYSGGFMRNFLFGLFVVLSLSNFVIGDTPILSVPAQLQEISVTIKSDNSEGSGVIKTRVLKDGKNTNFVWTAAHVVEGLRTVAEVVDPKTGTKRQDVVFKDCAVVKELVEEGRRVGELKMDATVIKISVKEDLALLRIRKIDFIKASVNFYTDDKIPEIGTELYHVGSLLGQMGSNSMTSGIVSQIGRTLERYEFDQSTCTAFPGSSGGGVYLKDGRYIGMLVRGSGEGFNLFVPARRMIKWAKTAHIAWAIDDKVEMPTDDELKNMSVEDVGTKFDDKKDTLKDFPYLIRTNLKELVVTEKKETK